MSKIYWDKGHRNSSADYGASANGLREADLVHKIVDYAMTYLNQHYTGFEQRTNRINDEVKSLKQRTDEANKWGADLYISVHINAAGGQGFETFIYTNAPASTIATQNVFHTEILLGMRTVGNISDRGKKRNNFHVLRETNMNAILTENLFIDSSDASYLKQESFLKATGEAHARAAAKYLGLSSKPVQVQAASSSGQALQKMIDKKIIQGYADGTLRENEPITLARLSIILDNLGLLD